MSTFTLRAGSEFEQNGIAFRVIRVSADGTVVLENLDLGERTQTNVREMTAWFAQSLDEALRDQQPNESIRNGEAINTIDASKSRLANSQRVLDYVSAIRQEIPVKRTGSRLENLIDEIGQKIGDPRPPTARTVARWLKQWDECKQVISAKQRPLPSYLKHPSFDLAIEVINTSFLSTARHPLSIAYALYTETANGKGIPTLSNSTFRRILRNEFDAFEVDKARLGKYEAQKRYRQVLKENGLERVYQVLELDHTKLDWVVCIAPGGIPLGRPTVVAIRDAKTNYVVAICITFLDPSVITVAKALKMAFFPKDMSLPEFSELDKPWLGFGAPEEIRFDNGMENHSFAIKEMLLQAGLSIPIKFCKARSPWQKPHIEALFSLMSRFLKVPAGYVAKPNANYDSTDPKQTAVIDLETFKKILCSWVETVANTQINQRTLQTPRLAFEEGFKLSQPPAIPIDERVFDLLATFKLTRTLRHDGIRVENLSYGGVGLSEIRKRNGENLSVEVRVDPEDLGQVRVQDPKTKDWVVGVCTESEYASGLSLAQHRKLREFNKRRLDELNIPLNNLQAKTEFYRLVEMEIAKGRKAKSREAREVALLEEKAKGRREKKYSEELDAVANPQVDLERFIDFAAIGEVEGWEEDLDE